MVGKSTISFIENVSNIQFKMKFTLKWNSIYVLIKIVMWEILQNFLYHNENLTLISMSNHHKEIKVSNQIIIKAELDIYYN